MKEVLHCEKPGPGQTDAPRAFQVKLSRILIGECKMKQSNVDAELCFRHDNGRLVCIMTIHVDDLKIAGEKAVVKELLASLERVFGELTTQWSTFTNCGVHHVQDPIAKTITLDQISFIAALRPIEHPQLGTGTNEEKCVDTLAQLYISLLGALAYATLTRVDVMVFIVALQRHGHAPEVQHVRKLNKLTRWVQRHPKKLAYRRFANAKPASGGSGADERFPSLYL